MGSRKQVGGPGQASQKQPEAWLTDLCPPFPAPHSHGHVPTLRHVPTLHHCRCFHQASAGRPQPAGDHKPHSRMWTKRLSRFLIYLSRPARPEATTSTARDMSRKRQHLQTYVLQSTKRQALEDRILRDWHLLQHRTPVVIQ